VERSGKGSRKAVRLFGKRRSNGALQAWRLRRRADKAKSATTREGYTTARKIRNLRGILNVVILSGTAQP